MITTINNMCACGRVVGDGPKCPDASEGGPRAASTHHGWRAQMREP
jgi:hypothetical protein